MDSFVHLHVHSQFSLLEAAVRPKQLVAKAAEFQMPAVAVTDYGNMFGAVDFYFAAKAKEVKPIIGLEVYLAPKGRLVKGEDPEAARMPNRRLVLLAEDYAGYQNLCRISSVGYKEGFYYKPRVDDEILKNYSENLIVLSGGHMGDIPWNFREQGPDAALKRIKFYKKLYGDRFYLELNRTGVADWKDVNQFLLEAGEKAKVPVVAANDVHYLEQSDQIAQEILICVGSNKTLQDPGRYRLGSDQFYFKSSEQMRELFKDVPRACDRSLEIADRCNIDFKLKDDDGKPIYHLPKFPTQRGRSEKAEIRAIAESGLKQRLKSVKDPNLDEYNERLEYELGVIDGMGFNGYFLIVQDFINWAKKHDIPVGPGRGSGAGSLVAYSLGITDLDPMPYNLLFERFLNPERISMPDFDIDFCQEKRSQVIDYVTEKYSVDSVSQIITFGKLQARAAIRDVGRVMGMTFAEVDVVAKLIPDKLNITLKAALEEEPKLTELMEDDPKVNTLLDLAQKVEGLTRHASIHAAGVVIADKNIVDLAPLYKGAAGENVVQYEMKSAEKIGLIKFDFLGLKTLTHVNDAIKLIRENRQKKISVEDIKLDDKGIYELMSKGDTAGVFQFEGEGITDTLKKAQPNCFEDIVAVNALYRPGPMDMIPDYVKRKKGETKVTYLFPELEDVLKETYGVIVYQEQVQLIAAVIAGYSLGEADVLRRAMGKKIAEEMDKQRVRFMTGAKDKGFDDKKAGELFDLMAKFAAYGFNKSHAAAYCVVAAYTAYLKAYYPVEFFAALLSTEMSDTDKIVKYVKDARKHDIEVRPPHINYSNYKFTVKGDEIYYSLGGIKGVGEAAVQAIIEARESREEKKFESLSEFFEVVDLRRVNKKTIECLIRAGALDGFGYNRAQLAEGYIRFIESHEQKRKDADVGQVSLFELSEDAEELKEVVLDPKEDWGRAEKLGNEKSVLGFYLSSHPLEGMDQLVRSLVSSSVQGLHEVENKSSVRVLGLISGLKEIITRKGTRMAFGSFEDTSGDLELVIFPDSFKQYETALKSEEALLVTGKLERDENKLKILVEKVERASEVYRRAKRLVLRLGAESSEKLALLKELFTKHPGQLECILQVELPDMKRTVEFKVKEPTGIDPSPHLFESVASLLEKPQWRLM